MNFSQFLDKYQKVPVEHYPHKVCQEPLISVCVQTYQHANFIKACLDGILMQKTDFAFEILVGEDESTDGTREICIKYAQNNPDKIRLFLHKRENNIDILGPSGRFNFLYNLFSVKGKYISLCEGDDYWTDPYKLQKQVDFLENNQDYSFCFHSVNRVDRNGVVLKKNESPANFLSPITRFSSEQVLAYGMLINTCSLCYRNSEFVMSNLARAPLWPFGDKTLEKLLAIQGGGFLICEPMACYRTNPSSVTQVNAWRSYGNKKHYKDHIKLYEYIKSLSDSKSQLNVINRVINRYTKSINVSEFWWYFSADALTLVFISVNKNIFYFLLYYSREAQLATKRFILKKILKRF